MTAKEYVKQQLSERLEQFRSEGIELVGTLHAAVFTAKDLEQAFEAGQQDAQRKWIDSRQRLPQQSEGKTHSDCVIVLLVHDDKTAEMAVDYYDWEHKSWYNHFKADRIYWIPCPELPKEGGEQ